MIPKFEFHGIKPAFINGGLRAFVQTVLPTIYDDSLSYYELLNKVVKHLNNVVSDVATLNTNQENFIAAVTDFINRYGIETYDVNITNPLDSEHLQLSEDDATSLFNAIENNKVVRVFVHNAANGTVYTCYYCTIDNSTVEPGVNKNDLYFAGFNFRQLESAATVIPWKIVKIERSGAITIYDNINAVTKKYVDDSISSTATAISHRIDGVIEKSPYKVFFDVYPDTANPSQFVIACDETPTGISMLNDAGRDVECYMIEKSSAVGAVINTIKADTIVFGQGDVIIAFGNIPYNPNKPAQTVYKKGYHVIRGTISDDEWRYQLSGKVSGKVDFNIEVLANNQVNLVSCSHTPAEVYRLYQEYNGFVPCDVYFNSTMNTEGGTIISHQKSNAVVSIADISQEYLINIMFDDLTNGVNALEISHYLVQGDSSNNSWNLSRMLYEYPVSAVTPESYGAVGDGVSDDTAAVRLALQKPVAYFSGTYKVTEPIAANSKYIFGGGTIICSNGFATFADSVEISGIRIVNSAGNAILLTKGGKIDGVEIGGGLKGILIQNNGANLDAPTEIKNCTICNMFGDGAAAISSQFGNQLLIHNCVIYDISNELNRDADGINVWESPDNPNASHIVIDQCKIYRCRGRLIKANTTNVTIRNCHLENPDDYETIGGEFRAIDVQKGNCVIENNTIKANGYCLYLQFNTPGASFIVNNNYVVCPSTSKAACICTNTNDVAGIAVFSNNTFDCQKNPFDLKGGESKTTYIFNNTVVKTLNNTVFYLRNFTTANRVEVHGFTMESGYAYLGNVTATSKNVYSENCNNVGFHLTDTSIAVSDVLPNTRFFGKLTENADNGITENGYITGYASYSTSISNHVGFSSNSSEAMYKHNGTVIYKHP